MTPATIPNLVTKPPMKLILADLEFGSATTADLQAVVRLSERMTQYYLRAAHEADLVHICGWEHVQGGRRIWGLGPGQDAPMRCLTPSMKGKRFRARLRERTVVAGGLR